MQDSDTAAQRREAALAGHRGDPGTARLHLQSNDPQVRATALGALDRLQVLTDAELTAGLCDTAPLVRSRSAAIAASYPNVSVVELLDDTENTVAEVAAWSCGERAATPGVVDALVAMADNHADPLCREAAIASLGALGDERAVQTILRAMSDVPQIRRRAALALAPFDGPEVVQALEKASEDRDWQVRQAAEDVLGR